MAGKEDSAITDNTLRLVDELAAENSTSSGKSSSSLTLTQTVWRQAEANVTSKGNNRRPQTIVTMIAAENMNQIFPEWVNFAYYGPPSQKKYRPYDLNMPLAIPRRPESHYKTDPPLTEHGKVCSSILAGGLARNNIFIRVIYCAPELAAVQTANTVSLGPRAGKAPIPIRVEPALANWRGFSKIEVNWCSLDFLTRLGYAIDTAYQPQLALKDLHFEETPQDYFRRTINFFTKLIVDNEYSCSLVIGHAGTLYVAADGNWESKSNLQHVERELEPSSVYGMHIGRAGEHNVLSRPTLPFTPTLRDAKERGTNLSKKQKMRTGVLTEK